jgi:hypothetical protein
MTLLSLSKMSQPKNTEANACNSSDDENKCPNVDQHVKEVTVPPRNEKKAPLTNRKRETRSEEDEWKDTMHTRPGGIFLLGSRCPKQLEHSSRARAHDLSVAYELGKVADFELTKLVITAKRCVGDAKVGPSMNLKQATQFLAQWQAEELASKRSIDPLSTVRERTKEMQAIKRRSDLNQKHRVQADYLSQRLLGQHTTETLNPFNLVKRTTASAQCSAHDSKVTKKKRFDIPPHVTTELKGSVTSNNQQSSSVAPTEMESPLSNADEQRLPTFVFC